MFEPFLSMLETKDPDYIYQAFELFDELASVNDIEELLNEHFIDSEGRFHGHVLTCLMKYSFLADRGNSVLIPRIDWVKQGIDLKGLRYFSANLQIKQLISIGHSHNQFPIEVTKFSSLKTLVMKDAYLRFIPAEITQLQKLEYLYLQSNNIDSLPSFLDQLPQLKLVNLLGQHLVRIDCKNTPLILSWGQIQELNVDPAVVVGISFHNEGLTSIPRDVLRYSNTSHFFLGGNKLKLFPEILREFKNLEALYLFGNEIRTLPDWLAERKSLRVLQLSSMSKLTVPRWVLQLPNLALIRFPNEEPPWFNKHPRYEQMNRTGSIMDIQ
jgi:Leucine-rich repeat (LRR) protein